MPSTSKRRTSTPRQVGLREGFRSGLEERLQDQIEGAPRPFVPFEWQSVVEKVEGYERFTLPYVKPSKPSRYTPDFVLPNGIIIESKGRFVTADRQKHLLIQKQHPDLDIRFVFSNANNRISKKSKTTYAMWSDKNKFLWADKWVPTEWFEEPFKEERVEAILKILSQK